VFSGLEIDEQTVNRVFRIVPELGQPERISVMCQPNKWWWGLLPLAILWLFAGFMRNDAIEQDLGKRSVEAFPWATVAFAGRDATVSGIAPDDAAKTAVLAQIDALPGVRKVASGDISVIPEQKPFTFDAKLDGKALTLEGFIPAEADRKAVTDAAKTAIPDVAITDNLKIARGAPAGFAAAAAFGVTQLASLGNGSFGMSDLKAKIAGIAGDFPKFDGAIAAAAPAGVELTKDIIPPTVEPFTFEARKEPEALTLNGFVPTEAAKVELGELAKTSLPKGTVTNNLRIAAGAPEGFAEVAKFSIGQAAKLTTGVAAIAGAAYSITGLAATPEIDAELSAAKPPGNFTPTAMVTAPEPAPAPAPVAAAPAAPYVFEASRDGPAVELNGTVPSENDRAAVVAAVNAAVPSASITDNLAVRADNVPDGFAAAAAFGVSQLGKLTKGITTLTDKAYFIGGQAPSEAVLQDVIAAAPQGFAADAPRVIAPEAAPAAAPAPAPAPAPEVPTASPYVFTVNKTETLVTLSGSVPSEEAKKNIAQAAAAAFPSATVDDTTEIAKGQPAGFDAMVGFAFGQVSKLTTGIGRIRDTDFTIAGAAPTTDIYGAVRQRVLTPPRGFKLASEAITAPTVSPYVWSVTKAPGAITLAGLVPSETIRSQLVDAAKAAHAGATVTDEMRIARGEQGAFPAMAMAGINQLVRLSDGVARIDNTVDYSIVGNAPTPADHDTAVAEAAKVQAGFRLAKADITAPVAAPYVFETEKTPETITLNGFYPDVATRANINQAATAAFPGAKIVDNLVISRGAPSNFPAMVGFGFGQLGKLTTGKTRIEDQKFSIEGAAPTVAMFDEVTGRNKTLPRAFGLDREAITAPTAKPYRWEIAKEAAAVTLTGFVPNEAAKAATVAATSAAIPGVTITDRQEVALGAPDGFDGMTALAIAEVAKLNRGRGALEDTAFTITGEAPEQAAKDQVRSNVASLPTGFGLAKEEITVAIPVVRPYRFEAVKADNNAITLNGLVPSNAERASVVSRARQIAGGAGVTDNLTVAKGLPSSVDYIQSSNFMLGELSKLLRGTATVEDADLTFTGDAAEATIKAAVEQRLNEPLIGGIKLKSQAITAPVKPYIWSADKAPGSLTLRGYYPDEAARQAVVKEATEKFPQDKVIDEMQPGLGAPACYSSATSTALTQLVRLGVGSAEFSDTALSLRGEAMTQPAADEITSAATAGVGTGCTAVAAITVRPAAPEVPKETCQELFKDILGKGQILFETDMADIKQASYGKLDNLVFVLNRCPEAKVEIAGHTDSRASNAYNQALADRRARSVVDYLTNAKINADRLKPVGYGETQPIAPNDSAENMSKNRRIEFVVQ
jgi:OmpA-OmpF porin, OOP family